MPKQTTTGTLGFGGLMPRWLRALFAWRDVRDDGGVWLYQENAATGERRAIRLNVGIHSPKDINWLERREPFRPSRPPPPSSDD